MNHVKTLIVTRHGTFEGNKRAELTGRAAFDEAAKELGLHDFDHLPLLEQGREEVRRARDLLAEFTIDAALCSPTVRTQESAAIHLEHRSLIGGFAISEALRERNRGIFSFAPDEWTRQHPGYRIGKESTLHWRPISGAKPGQEGETQFEVQQRIQSALDQIDAMAPGGTGMLITHGEAMVSVRGLNRFLGLTDETYKLPLIPHPPAHLRALNEETGQVKLKVIFILTPMIGDTQHTLEPLALSPRFSILVG